MYIYSKFHVGTEVFVWDDKFEGVFRKKISAIHVTMTKAGDVLRYEMEGELVDLLEEKYLFDNANSAFWANPEPTPEVHTDPELDIPNDQPEF